MSVTRHPEHSRGISHHLVISDLIGNLYRFIPYLAILCIAGVVWIYSSISTQKPISISPSFSTSFAYDNRTLLPAVAQNTGVGTGTSPRILVLPHHLTASTIIARGISLLTPNPPKTIILLSPNHANIGQCDIASSNSNWDTPFGQVSVDQNLLDIFLETKTVCLDDAALKVEHGIAGLLPFIKYYLPDTKIVPLALKKDLDPILMSSFIEKLISISPGVTTLASVDFSHGLIQKESLKRDLVTKKLIISLNYTELLKLSSEYMDSPASLVSVLKIIDSKMEVPNIQVHTDSSAFNGNSTEVTSYFLITGGVFTPGFETSSLRGGTPTRQSSIDSFTLLFGGDVMLGRSVNTRMLKHSDFTWPFLNISLLLSSADISLVNLESPFHSGCSPTDSGMVFCADPRSIAGLKLSGIDIVNLANNHINNQGKEGLAETLTILSQAGIATVGQNMPYSVTVKNTKLAFLGFTDITSGSKEIATATSENIRSQISQAKKDADLVIATFHWGNEYKAHSLRQTELAHLAIDSGADVVIGHHPHWIQEVEEYKGKPIYYSLGNLVFDQMWSEETRKGILVKLTFSGNKLVDEESIPIKIFDYGQPSLVN